MALDFRGYACMHARVSELSERDGEVSERKGSVDSHSRTRSVSKIATRRARESDVGKRGRWCVVVASGLLSSSASSGKERQRKREGLLIRIRQREVTYPVGGKGGVSSGKSLWMVLVYGEGRFCYFNRKAVIGWLAVFGILLSVVERIGRDKERAVGKEGRR